MHEYVHTYVVKLRIRMYYVSVYFLLLMYAKVTNWHLRNVNMIELLDFFILIVINYHCSYIYITCLEYILWKFN